MDIDTYPREWTLPQNMRNPGYVPPVVQQGIVSETTFWEMAIANTEADIANLSTLMGQQQNQLEHALKMAKAARNRARHG